MKEEQYKTIIYEPGPITRIIHDEPNIRNALSGHFILELSDALKRFQRDRSAVVAVIGATGNVFCAGHNLEFVSKMDDWKPSETKILDEREWREQMDFMRDNLYFPLYDCKKPLVAAVQGDAHAGGIDLMHMCDIVVAAETAIFHYSILRTSGGGGANLLPYFIGFKKATELYLTGGKIGAPEMERLGAINKVVPVAEVDAEAMRYAKIISLMPAETLKLVKQSLRFSLNRMGARDTIWFGYETNILGHLNSSPREKEFYTILKEKGMRVAVEFRDEPFRKLGV